MYNLLIEKSKVTLDIIQNWDQCYCHHFFPAKGRVRSTFYWESGPQTVCVSPKISLSQTLIWCATTVWVPRLEHKRKTVPKCFPLHSLVIFPSYKYSYQQHHHLSPFPHTNLQPNSPNPWKSFQICLALNLVSSEKMVADKAKKSKVGQGDDSSDHIDGELVLSIEKLQELQDELEKVQPLKPPLFHYCPFLLSVAVFECLVFCVFSCVIVNPTFWFWWL